MSVMPASLASRVRLANGPDQRLAAVQHQRRYPPQRIERRDLVGIAESRPRPVLEGEAVEPQRDGDAAGEGESYWPIRNMGLGLEN